jgi:hypothetical protein
MIVLSEALGLSSQYLEDKSLSIDKAARQSTHIDWCRMTSVLALETRLQG